MKLKIFSILLIAIFLFFIEHGLLTGLGGRPSTLALSADLIIWMVFFFGKKPAFPLAFLGGFLADIISPYGFGAVILAMLAAIFSTEFLSVRVFTNRTLYSYTFVSFFALASYFFILFLAGILNVLIYDKIMVPPLEFSAGEITAVFGWNLALMLILFFATNILTRKMHAAFIVK